MKSKILVVLFSLLLVFPASAQTIFKSTAEDQEAIEVTIYNSNLGLIKDIRTIDIPSGLTELRFMDVAAHIKPVTVQIKSLNSPQQLSILEQNYEYDLMNAEKLLDKYVGKTIKLIDTNKYQGSSKTIEAILLSNNNGQIYQIDGEIHLGHKGRKVLPEIPENLIANPTLTWLANNTSDNAHKLQVSYLTNNVNWKADYIVALNDDDTLSDINGWVTINNQSGTIYKDAKLKLVAGEVNRVYDAPMRGLDLQAKMAFAAEAVGGSGFQEEAFFEYHIYDLQRKTTIKNNQTKQISLLEAEEVKVEKKLLVNGNSHYYLGRYHGRSLKSPVNVYVKFINNKENNLGMPLPAGVMRLYKADSQGSLQFIGEDRIEHTPKDEEIQLKIGEAFDVVVERIQTDYRNIGPRDSSVYETAWEITLKNHKQEAVVVSLIEPMPRDNWNILDTTHPFKKIDAFTLRYDIEVPVDGEIKLKYRARMGDQSNDYGIDQLRFKGR